MTAPTFGSFTQIVAGWIFTAHHTIAGSLLASGVAGSRHHSAYYRIFSECVWDVDQVGWNLAKSLVDKHRRISKPLVDKHRRISKSPVYIVLDDTNTRKTGRKIYGTGLHYDPMAETSSSKKSTWANNWVVLGILATPLRGCQKRVAMTVQTRLYVSPKDTTKADRPYQTKLDLAIEMVRTLCEQYPDQIFRLLCDAAYGVGEMIKRLPANCQMISRLRHDSRFYRPLEPQAERGPGRPRIRGERMEKAAELFESRCKTRRTLTLYGKPKKVEWVTFKACLYQAPGRVLRVVLVRIMDEKSGKAGPLVTLHSTDPAMSAEEVIETYCQRWSIEETFQEAKEYLGLEEPQCRSRKAVERMVPSIFYLHTILWQWAGEERLEREAASRKSPWNRATKNLSIGDIISILRENHLEELIKSNAVECADMEKLTKPLALLLRAA
jgi:hypothetical protein